MRYMGSKRRIADEILPIILNGRKPSQYYVEPFCGGCNTLERVDGKRIAGDVHPELIAMYKALQRGWKPPVKIGEEEYKRIMSKGSPELKGYAGFTHSFGGKYGSTYRRHNDLRSGQKLDGRKLKGAYSNIEYVGGIAYRMMTEQIAKLQDVKFNCCEYYDLDIPKKSIVYCDPPYENTTKYKLLDGKGAGGLTHRAFLHYNFHTWCRNLASEGHTVFVSEYDLPEDFTCVWEKEVTTHLTAQGKGFKKIEKLFTLK